MPAPIVRSAKIFIAALGTSLNRTRTLGKLLEDNDKIFGDAKRMTPNQNFHEVSINGYAKTENTAICTNALPADCLALGWT